MKQLGTIYGINGPIVYVKGRTLFQMSEKVFVGKEKLIGEVITLDNERTTIQVYEETSGMKPGEPVYSTGSPVSVTLGPGILNNIFDGIERPLKTIAELSGEYIHRGADVKLLDTEKKWPVHVTVEVGQEVIGGTIIAEVPETKTILHKSMIPPDIEGRIVEIVEDGEYTITEPIVKVQKLDESIIEIKLAQEWPIRNPRPTKSRFESSIPLVTGQRVVDSLFPIAKGGTAAIPGGFGTGKTMMQHQIAKYSDADIIIYIGCGERGNEMTEVLEDFSELIDPKSGNSLMERTSLIANTSNMPVAAREASIYTGTTLAEYYRDMGYDVAIMADSTSRWAEALRELSGRLEEMPAEEGFPAYLASRIATFYERAGLMQNFNDTEGSVSIIGAVSPQGGDFSEPVTQNTKRFVRCFWGLDKALAHERHYPAVNWLDSYSEYIGDLAAWYRDNVSPDFVDNRRRIVEILHQESSLMDVVKLIGSDVLPDDQKLTIEIGRVIRLGFLQQNAFHSEDTSVPLKKQGKMMEIILYLRKRCKSLISHGMPMSLLQREDIFTKIIAIKYDVPNNKLEMFDQYKNDIDEFYTKIMEKNA
ncbi:MAG: V-type ATP synthase subunit A [Alkalibacterium sp.]|uniref:V-type ATP synthase alpha chain n=1 Tax=Alkalibacterium gilvum TaxID=1130080 RepID=A0A1H6UTL1_9LACT|nr:MULTISPECIES: V-type ATP synthase subunit A [Alkalibacterium]MDN6193677.1 V-type ATP synthase subunit A [Alkalibacterium sp.]MDN6294301.1 V-type ATP synthase subunit A [Alkalibacterium sp.]MDN6295531.1 V-type ATP synthase subunit A [Alkalibacterium sp.]MDN6326406.1 V-type ATP synthase subunit A [Alkalibacterium sp.]MDN6398032.1 V-type ATP synthase subunit A [Alkalibacterium sp.]